jgi:hypothetical protein
MPNNQCRTANNPIIVEFRRLCQEGSSLALLAYIREHKITSEEVRSGDNFALRMACMRGKISSADLLIQHFKLTKDDFCADENFAFRWACLSNEREAIPFLRKYTAKFGLDASVARSCDNWALKAACENGQFATIQWLVQHFGLNKNDVTVQDCRAVSPMTQVRKSEIAEWFNTHFEMNHSRL